jgi:hypothetical protein
VKILTVSYDNFIDHMADAKNKFPACFDSKKQWKAWYEVEAIAHTKPRLFPCRDCTNEYHSQMAAAGRCCNADLPGIKRIFNKGT